MPPKKSIHFPGHESEENEGKKSNSMLESKKTVLMKSVAAGRKEMVVDPPATTTEAGTAVNSGKSGKKEILTGPSLTRKKTLTKKSLKTGNETFENPTEVGGTPSIGNTKKWVQGKSVAVRNEIAKDSVESVKPEIKGSVHSPQKIPQKSLKGEATLPISPGGSSLSGKKSVVRKSRPNEVVAGTGSSSKEGYSTPSSVSSGQSSTGSGKRIVKKSRKTGTGAEGLLSIQGTLTPGETSGKQDIGSVPSDGGKISKKSIKSGKPAGSSATGSKSKMDELQVSSHLFKYGIADDLENQRVWSFRIAFFNKKSLKILAALLILILLIVMIIIFATLQGGAGGNNASTTAGISITTSTAATTTVNCGPPPTRTPGVSFPTEVGKYCLCANYPNITGCKFCCVGFPLSLSEYGPCQNECR